jgi:rhodanese-related sulfurtransferase
MADYVLVSAKDAARAAASGATILDVRREDEHSAQRLAAAHALVPLDQLDPKDFMLRHGLDSGAPVYMLCRSGKRAVTAAEMFARAGCKNIYVIEGGILACAAHGIATEGTHV